MYQFDDATAVSALPAPAAQGTPGFFTDGNPATNTPATLMRSDFMNMLMMEMLNVVTAAGLAPSKTTYNQMLTAIQQLSVSAVEQALAYKVPALVATTGANIALTGLQTIDGVLLAAGNRVLVKDQTNPQQNGIYVASAGAWSLASDVNTAAELVPAMLVPVQAGTANADTVWQLKTQAPIVIGTSNIVFQEASANLAQFALLSQIQAAIQENLYSACSAGGTSDALTGSFTPAITSTTMATGVVELTIRAAYANATTTPTFTPNPGVITPAAIVKGNGLSLAAGDIAGAGHWITLQWDATLSRWVLLNPATGVNAMSGIQGAFKNLKVAATAPISLTGTWASSSTSLTVSSNAGLIANGTYITGSGIPASTYVTNVSGTTVTISQATTASGSATALTAYPLNGRVTTADALEVSNGSGLYLTLQNVNVTGNILASVANGLDTGTVAALTWYYEYVIYNPSTLTPAKLYSLSATAPTLPSGYTMFARTGSVYADSNKILRTTIQYGRNVQYATLPGSNATISPILTASAQGTPGTTVVTLGLSAFIPPTASRVRGFMWCANSNTVQLSPNSMPGLSYGGPMAALSSVANNAAQVSYDFAVESMNLYYAASVTPCGASVTGWEENL